MLINLIIVSLILTIGFSEWRWSNDTMELTHDKEAHFVGSAGAYFFFKHKDYTTMESIRYTFYLGLAKECIDAVVPWEEYGAWGGDGFSKNDLTYNVSGIMLAVLLDKIWKPKENSNWERRFSTNSISISYRIYTK